MKTLLSLLIITSLLIPSFSLASFLGFVRNSDIIGYQQQLELIKFRLDEIQKKIDLLLQGGDLLGAVTQPIAGTAYTLSGSGVSGSATSITLTSLTLPQTGYEIADSDLPTTFYITLEPGSRTRQEIVSCTTSTQSGSDATATLSGCTRGLLPISPYTASSSYQFAHGGGTAVVFSNPPQLYEEFAAVANNETITGIWTFSSSSLPRASSTPTYGAGDELKFVTYGQLASTSFTGTVDGSLTQKGIFEVADKSELANGSSTGGTSAFLIPINSYFNASSSATTTVPVTGVDGKLSNTFIATSSVYLWTGTSTITGSFTASSSNNTLATTTFTGMVSLPTTTPTLGIHATNKAYVDSHAGLIFASSSQVTVNATTVETNLVTVSIPSGTFGTSTILHLRADLQFQANAAANTSAIAVRYGGSIIATTTMTFVGNSDDLSGYVDIYIYGDGATNAQEASMWFDVVPGIGTRVTKFVTGTTAIDSTAIQPLQLTATHNQATGQNTIRQRAFIEQLRL